MIFNFEGQRILFIEPPKNATTSVRQWFMEHGEVDKVFDKKLERHYAFADILNVLRDARFDFMFSIIRHPLDRLVSEYKYMEKLALNPSEAVKNDLHTKASQKLIYDAPDLNYFIRDYFHTSEFPMPYLEQKKQSKMLMGRDGKSIPSKIHLLHFENLADDFNHMLTKILDEKTRIKYGDAKLPYYNTTKRTKGWRGYYHKDSLEIALKFYEKDMQEFGYEIY